MEFPHRGSSRSDHAEGRAEDAKRNKYAIQKATERLTQKIFELELLEVMARETGSKLRTKEKEIAEHKRKLEESQYEKWSKMNDFCDRVWKFSSTNGLTDLLNKYLDMPKQSRPEIVAVDNERHPEVLKLKSDLDKLKEQLADKKARTVALQEAALQAKVKLSMAETYREKDPTIIRLTREIDKYRDEVSGLETRIKAMKEEKSRDWSRPFLTPLSAAGNDDFVTAAALIAREENDSSAKRTKFTVKKESAISRKLAGVGSTSRRD